MSLSKLPLELYLEILGYIQDKSTIYSLLFISRAFHHQTLQRLYHTLRTESLAGWFLSALQTVVANHEIASLVSVLDVALSPLDLKDNIAGKLYTFRPLLRKAYRLMNNIKVFRVDFRGEFGFYTRCVTNIQLRLFRSQTTVFLLAIFLIGNLR